MESRACGVLGGKIGRIKASNVDPVWLAERLQAQRIIGQRDLERAKDDSIPKPERRGELVELVQGNGRRGVFRTFVNLLLSEPYLDWLGEELKDDFTSQGGDWEDVQSQQIQIVPGYDLVKSHLVDITKLLNATKGAREALTQHYVQEGWLDHTQNPSEDELVRQALQRMEIDPSQYYKFLTMLRSIKGLDIVVKSLTHVQDCDTTANTEDEIQSQLDLDKQAILYDDSGNLCKKFFKFINRTVVRLKKKVTAQDLSAFVIISLNCQRMKYPDDLPDKLKECKEVNEVLQELTREGCDVIVFHDIDVLESIIQEYFSEDDEELKQYTMELENYLRRRICEHHLFHPDIVGTEVVSVSENAKLYVFMDSTWTRDMSSRKLFKLKKRLAAVLECAHIRLTKIRVGSLCFCYTILTKDFEHSELKIEQVLSLINFGVKRLDEEIYDCKYSKKMEETYKVHWENLTLPMLPSSLPCSDWRGLPLTEGNVQTVVQKSQVLECKDWPKTLRCFSLPAFDVMEHPLLTQKTQYLSESWFKPEEDQHWWGLGMKLIRCCKRQEIKTVYEFMKKVAIYNNDDAPFQSKDMLKALDISPSSAAYEMLKKTKQVDFEDYLRDHPNAFSWKNVAVVLYRCGDEERMDILFKYMKSPEDTSLFLSISKVEEILQNLGQEDYKALYRELHCIPPPKHGSYSMLGIKLWLLTSPMRSWTEIAWGLYRSCLDNADKALKQARHEIMEDEGEENVVTRDNFEHVLEKTRHEIIVEGEKKPEDVTKLVKIAQYLRDRYGCKKISEQKMESGAWLDQWCELYPNPTRTVVYQALIYIGENAAARSLLPSHPQDFTAEKATEKGSAKDMLDVLGYIKSWPALYSELKRLHESDVVTDSEECSDVTVYVKNHNPSWRDIARAAYCCGEEAVMERIFKYVGLNILKDKVHALVQKQVKGREAFDRLYEYMKLPPLPENMPPLAGIDLWLLTCPYSWGELAWTFYRCQLPAAVIEVKTYIIEDESFTPENIHKALSKTKNKEQILSQMLAQTQEFRLEDCIKSHPCLSWSVLIAMLLQAKEKDAANYILQTHEFHVKGCLLTKRNVEIVLKMFLLRKQEEANWKTYGEHFKMPSSHISDLPVLDKVAKLSEHWLQNEQFPVWWRLREILFNCCHEYIDEIRLVMSDVQEQVVTDAAFTADNIMDALKKSKAWESFYFTVTGNHIYDDFPEFKDVLEERKKSLETFMRKRPGKISWVDLAVAAYLCGEEEIFDPLSVKMRSPKDPTLSYRAVKVLLEKHHLSTVQYAGLNAELGVPLLLRKCSDCFGIRLWLLRDPSVTWTDLAVALYNLNTKPTDNALMELKHKYLPNTDSTFNPENLKSIVQETYEWKLLGFLIGDRNSQDGFQIFQESKGQETFMMLREWQKMHPYASWTLLYQALIKMNERVMSKHVLTTFLSGPPTQREGVFATTSREGETEINIINLHHFPVPIGGRRSIITLVAPQYRCLGAHLLNDKRGNVVQSIYMANFRDPVGIMTAIFTQWLKEDTDCSWKKLIECMKRCDLTHFAQEMEVALGLVVQDAFTSQGGDLEVIRTPNTETRYDLVKSYLVDITKSLSAKKGAREALTQHYVQQGWLDHTQNPSEDELVRQALERIKIDHSQYDKFLTMLRSIKGLDLIVAILTHVQDTAAKTEDEILSRLDLDKRAILYDDSENLCIEFSNFLGRTEVRLMKKVTAPELSEFVLTRLSCLRMKYPDDLPDKLNMCKEVNAVLRELTREGCDVIVFHDIDILESIIRKYFAEDDEELKQYNWKLDNYLRRRICEHHLFHPDIVGTEVVSVSENAKLYVFMDSTWTRDMSSRKLFKLKKRLAAILECSHIRLTEIRVG